MRIAALSIVVVLSLSLSAPGVSAQPPGKDEQKCLKAMSVATAKLVKAQQKQLQKCSADAARGKLPSGQTAQQCLTLDAAGKIATAVARTSDKAASTCALPPAFGYAGPTAVNSAAIGGTLASIADLYGTDIDAAFSASGGPDVVSKCQAAVFKSAANLLNLSLKELRGCNESGFKAGTHDSSSDLEACLDALSVDASGKIARARTKLADTLAGKCEGLPAPLLFPGTCAAAPDVAACLATRIRCRTCRIADQSQGLGRDCDTFDDGTANASCSPACSDADEDSFFSACPYTLDDCDDGNPARHPGAGEICNLADDDCDGNVDDGIDGAGASCGTNSSFPCTFGSQQCSLAGLVCTGEVAPGVEVCNGIDDDCDGGIDSTGGQPPSDSTGACSIPLPPPQGATSPCRAGTRSCVDGVVGCSGAVGPGSASDTCGVDANCDGVLTNQPDLMTDVSHCGGCGNLCASLHGVWSCVTGQCQFLGCQSGYYDLDNDQACETPCIFTSTQEACNGLDDDCDGQIDEDVVAPSRVAVCGTSAVASSPECTSEVSISCTGGLWVCSFPAGVCTGGNCGTTAESCDGYDNDCDGLVDEDPPCGGCPAHPAAEICDGCDNDCDGVADNGVAPIACGLPSPANCAGVQTCSPSPVGAPGACTTVRTSCSSAPQNEQCDGLDNDCDGIADDSLFPETCVPDGTPGGLIYGGNSQCRQGQKPCNGVCTGFVGPSAEICDGVDNDCDGQTDESPSGVGQPCGLSRSPCSPGVTACMNGALGCLGGVQPQPEICDGIDNDCDGETDDFPLADAPAPGSIGCWTTPGNCCSFANLAWCPPSGATCKGNGTLTAPCNRGSLTCDAGAWTCVGPRAPTGESCDGLDNDCDGSVDEGGPLCGNDLSCQSGACR